MFIDRVYRDVALFARIIVGKKDCFAASPYLDILNKHPWVPWWQFEHSMLLKGRYNIGNCQIKKCMESEC